uniref:hypothetical protein n=1 Tax=Thaumasiovibrio occultus TaxID=1891184 RepID=UPI000B35C755|nr:hypothetical protein [Thaumasiovibrio occultus]
MIAQLIQDSLNEFDVDYRQFCRHHYPTVHNRGMKSQHLIRLFATRMWQQFKAQGVVADYLRYEGEIAFKCPIHSLALPSARIWIVADQWLSANTASRKRLIDELTRLKSLMDSAHQHYVVVLADHWFDRSLGSKQLPAWWLGHLPDDVDTYILNGLKLQLSPVTLVEALKATLPHKHAAMTLRHPLHKPGSSVPVYRYLLMTATITF